MFVDCPVYPILSTREVVTVWDQTRNNYGAVTVVRHHLSCLSCSNSTACEHVGILKSLEGSSSLHANAENILKAIKENAEPAFQENELVLSFRRIPFVKDLQPTVVAKELELYSKVEDDAAFILTPKLDEDSRCPECGSEWSSENPVENDWLYGEDLTIFMDMGIFKAKGNSNIHPSFLGSFISKEFPLVIRQRERIRY